MDLLNPYYLQIVMFFHHQCHHGYLYLLYTCQWSALFGAAGFMSVGAYVGLCFL